MKLILPIAIVVMILATIVIVLANNKIAIDKANTAVDRSKIPVAVSVAHAKMAPMKIQVQYPALLQPIEEAMAYSQASGLITSLNIELGQRVKKGEVLGRLDTRLLHINLNSAQISASKLKEDYARAKDLYENNAGLKVNMLTAKSNYENAEEQVKLIEQQIENTKIIAPITGIISLHKIKEGEFVNPGNPIASISNISTIKTTVFVDQQLAYKLDTGHEAEITSPLFGGKELIGVVSYVSPVADANHNYQVDLLITDNQNISLKGGTDVQVAFNAADKERVLQVPKSAVMTEASKPYVFVVETSRAMKRHILTGMVDFEKVEVTQGLKPGEQVVINGQINLDEGDLIEIRK